MLLDEKGGNSIKPNDYLIKGIEIMNPFLNQNGFYFSQVINGIGSGGEFASGYYKNNNKILELNYRYGLGLVAYQIDDKKLFHEELMKMLGVYGKNRYPGFSTDRLKAFEDLLSDIEEFAIDFVSGSGDEFKELERKFANNPNMFKGLKGI